MMQDGCTRAASWDGGQATHINPTISGQEFTKEGLDGTVIGTWMAWAGNRLWVARDNEIFAGDFGNPLKFTETQYIAEGRAFYMPEEVTGMGVPSQAADRSPLIVFGQTTNTQIRSDIQDRSKWLDTPNFQVENNTIGCIAGKSITNSYGQMWWYSLSGWTSYNNTMQTLNDSKFRYMDNEMGVSKSNISPTTDCICAASFENYLLVSVPSGNLGNRHTWVYDQQTNSSGKASWNGYWTGIRPVEWWSGSIDGVERIFCLSQDYDGVNRVWEAFDPSRTDNGAPITCFAETKQHNFGNSGWKTSKYTKIHLDEVLGDLDFAAYTAGRKGGYKKVLDKRMIASCGPFSSDGTYCAETDQYQSWKPQSRVIKTQTNDREDDDCNECGVESEMPNHIDTSFGNLFLWSGRAAVRMYQILAMDANTEREDWQGKCEQDETGVNILTIQGCGSNTTSEDLGCAFTAFEDSATQRLSCKTGISGDDSLGVGIGSSYISELDATKKAEANAMLNALETSNCKRCQPPEITKQPVADCVGAGAETTLSVIAASCTGNDLSYQWYVGEVGDVSAPIDGATDSFITISPTLDQVFWVRVSDECGEATDSFSVEVCASISEFSATFGVTNNTAPQASEMATTFGVTNNTTPKASEIVVTFGITE
jgi:hypothetical protein